MLIMSSGPEDNDGDEEVDAIDIFLKGNKYINVAGDCWHLLMVVVVVCCCYDECILSTRTDSVQTVPCTQNVYLPCYRISDVGRTWRGLARLDPENSRKLESVKCTVGMQITM